MKKILSLTAIALFLFANSAIADIYKKKVVLEKKSFSEIVVRSSVDVEIYKVSDKSQAKVVLCSEKGDFERFEYSVSGGTLYLSQKSLSNWDRRRRNRNDYDKRKVEIYIVGFEELRCSSSADIVIMDSFNFPSLRLTASSSGDIKFGTDITVLGDMYINISSSGDMRFRTVTVNGNMEANLASSGDAEINVLNVAERFEASISSSGLFEVREHTAGSFMLSGSSSGDYEARELHVKKGVMNVSLSSSSTFKADRATVADMVNFNSISTSSSARFYGKNVKLANAKVSTSGSSRATVNVSNTLSIIEATSSSYLYYINNFGLEIKIDGSIGSSVRIKKIELD